MKEDHCSLMIDLQLTQNKLERVSGKLKEQDVLNESLREGDEARRHGG